MTSISVDSISQSDAPPSKNSWKPANGEQLSGRITYLSQYVRTNYNKDGREQVLRIDLTDAAGNEWSLYPVTNNEVGANGEMLGYANRMAKAIGRACRAANANSVDIGGWLTLQRGADESTAGGAAHTFTAGYQAPAPGTQPVAVDQVAPTPAPAPAAVPAVPGSITDLV